MFKMTGLVCGFHTVHITLHDVRYRVVTSWLIDTRHATVVVSKSGVASELSEPRLSICLCFLLTRVDTILALTSILALPVSAILAQTVYLLQHCDTHNTHVGFTSARAACLEWKHTLRWARASLCGVIDTEAVRLWPSWRYFYQRMDPKPELGGYNELSYLNLHRNSKHAPAQKRLYGFQHLYTTDLQSNTNHIVDI